MKHPDITVTLTQDQAAYLNNVLETEMEDIEGLENLQDAYKALADIQNMLWPTTTT